jgi:hypothetical protein
MKVNVENLLPNPFRKMDRYPILKDKVSSLVESIKDCSFWDNIVGRKGKNGKYEIAYGHHRLEALKKAKIKDIDLIIRDLDDHQMIRIMANENMEVWRADANVIRETVRVAKEELEKEFKDKGSSFYLYKMSKFEKGGESDRREKQWKDHIGADDIQWLLGGAWKNKYQALLITDALTQITAIDEEGIIDEEDLRALTSPKVTRAVVTAVKKHFPKRPKDKKEKQKRKNIIRNIVKKLKSGNLSRENVDAEMTLEISEGIKEEMEPEVQTKESTLRTTFGEIIKSCSKLDKEIAGFQMLLSNYEEDHKDQIVRGWERFTSGYNLLMFVKNLQWLWELIEKRSEIRGKSNDGQKQIAMKGGNKDD